MILFMLKSYHFQGENMKLIKTGYVFLCLALFLLSGCAHFQVRGMLDDVMPVDGTITSFLLEGYSNIYLHTVDEQMYCSGVMMTTFQPTLSLSCDQEEGSVTLDCNNGRIIVTNWKAAGCNQGSGHGWTDHGAELNFAFFTAERPRPVQPLPAPKACPYKA
jgi:hypothetical protein